MRRAQELDATDPLSRFRERFQIAADGLIYLDGNSLGRQPKAAAEVARRVAEKDWGNRLVRAWGDSWFEMPQRLGAKIARVIGAESDEVIVADSTTINLFKLVVAALKARPGRAEVLTDDLNFPSDLYAIQSGLDLAVGPGPGLRVAHARDRLTIEARQLEALLSPHTALFTTSLVSFKSAFMHDMKAITKLVHRVGAFALWDLSHAVGAVPVDLRDAEADLAVGCTYKYLNGGPGAPAFLYVRKEIQEELNCPIWGWFGHADPFAFDLHYSARQNVNKFLVGTPPILSLAAIEPGVDMVIEAGMEAIRAKSIRQTDFLIDLWEEHLQPLGVTLNSPRDHRIRGSHISFGHPNALQIDRALIEEMNVVPDFRAPDNIRYGACPLYTTFCELEEGVLRFRKVVEKRLFEGYSASAPIVT